MTQVEYATFSAERRIAPLNISTGIMAGARVLTMRGYQPVEELKTAEKIITRSGMCVLRALTISHVNCAPLRISHDALTKDRPNSEMYLMPGQKVLLRDWRAKVMFGHDMVIVPLDRLKDDEYITQEPHARSCKFYNLHFDEEQIFYADGVELVSPALFASDARMRMHSAA